MIARYFETPRREVLPHVPSGVQRVLELGCGSAATLRAILERDRRESFSWAGGVELDQDAADKAKEICQRVWVCNAETEPFESEIEPGSLDLILCLDVLEHLVDPWRVVERFSPLLRPGGRLVVSIPNIRNWKFIWRLITRGDFRYRDAGLLDRTHLRFFVRETAVELVTKGGLNLVYAGNAHPWASSDFRSILNRVTLGCLEDLMIKQYVLVAEQNA
jgi:SAM-dependent methyltransferase